MVLEGTVQRITERVRVTANLIDAAHERPLLPSLVIDRAFDDALTTQDDIAREVCDGIRAVLSRAPARRYSQEPEAYHAFKRGQHLWRSCFEGGWRPAIEHFQHAIDRDPQFALAHVALAGAYNFLGFFSPGQAEPRVCGGGTGGRTGAGHRSDARVGIRRAGAREVRRRLGLGWGRTGLQAGSRP